MDTERLVDNPVDKSSVDISPQHVSEAERLSAQKKRSIWLALALFGFVILIGLTSALQLKENIQRNADANQPAPDVISAKGQS